MYLCSVALLGRMVEMEGFCSPRERHPARNAETAKVPTIIITAIKRHPGVTADKARTSTFGVDPMSILARSRCLRDG